MYTRGIGVCERCTKQVSLVDREYHHQLDFGRGDWQLLLGSPVRNQIWGRVSRPAVDFPRFRTQIYLWANLIDQRSEWWWRISSLTASSISIYSVFRVSLPIRCAGLLAGVHGAWLLDGSKYFRKQIFSLHASQWQSVLHILVQAFERGE